MVDSPGGKTQEYLIRKAIHGCYIFKDKLNNYTRNTTNSKRKKSKKVLQHNNEGYWKKTRHAQNGTTGKVLVQHMGAEGHGLPGLPGPGTGKHKGRGKGKGNDK